MVHSMRFVASTCLLCALLSFSTSPSAGALQTSVQRLQHHPVFEQEKNRKVVRQQDIIGLTSVPDESPNVSVLPLWKARTLLMLVASLYGLDYSVFKILQRKFMPEVISTLKYSLAALYFLPTFIRSKNRLRSARVGVELGLWCTIYAISISHAVKTTPASKVSFFASLGMILAPIYDIIFPDNAVCMGSVEESAVCIEMKIHSLLRTIMLSPFIAPVLAIAGVLIMECEQFTSPAINWVPAGTVTQSLRLLVSPLASSMCYWRASRLSKESEKMPQQQQQQPSHDEGAVSAVMLATVGLLCGTVCFMKYGVPEIVTSSFDANALKTFVMSCRTHIGLWSLLSSLTLSVIDTARNILSSHGTTLLLILVSSLLATGWSTLTEQRALRVVSAAQVSVLLSLEPLFATFFAYALLGEKIGSNVAVAAVFIVAASLWCLLAEKLL